MKPNLGFVYYDGLCIACSLEINHYRKISGAEKFVFVDITNPEFKPQDHGVDPFLVHSRMHVKGTDGVLYQGVDAFRAIWLELPRYQFLHRLSSFPAVRTILELGYKFFVKIRPYLPRRKASCETSPYCELNVGNKESTNRDPR